MGMLPAMHDGEAWGFTHDEMPDLTGHVVVVTGGNTGLGYWTARHLAAKRAKVVIGCRSKRKCNEAAQRIKDDTGGQVLVGELDLASFASIRSFASDVSAHHPSIDSLVLNAGVMMPPFGTTKEGLETQIGTNHFGHQLLTKLLLPQVEAAAAAKGVATVAVVSSAAHFDSVPGGIRATLAEMNDPNLYDRTKAYGQSKLANVLFAQELAERVREKGILVNSLHPGGVDTELFRHVQDTLAAVHPALASWFDANVMKGAAWRPEDAALTQLYAAVGPKLKQKGITGKYFHPIARQTRPDPHAQNATLQRRLWELTEAFIAEH